MTGTGPARALRRAARLALAALLAATSGCAPWLSPATRPGLDAGEWELGLGLAWLAPPSLRLWEGLPAPQIRVSTGVGGGSELQLTYAPPRTFEALARLEVVDRSGTTVDLHAGGGWLSFGGAFDVPAGGVPFLRGGATVVGRSESEDRTWFATLALTAPFKRHEGDRTAWTAWASGVVGLRSSHDGWGVAPQLGAVASLARPGEGIWFPGLVVDRTP